MIQNQILFDYLVLLFYCKSQLSYTFLSDSLTLKSLYCYVLSIHTQEESGKE